MNATPSISIIVPVYNTVGFLPQCLDSLVNQTFQSIEMIAVNDGSTDESLAILEDYARRYPNIRIFSQENQGVGASRNTGLQQAGGEFVLFVDSDDWIEPNACEILYRQAQQHNCDMICFEFSEISDNQTKRQRQFTQKAQRFHSSSAIANLLRSRLSGHCCNKMYRLSVLQSNQITFEEGIIYEELMFNLRALAASNKIIGIRRYLYNYRQRAHSLSKDYNSLRQPDLLQQTLKAIDFIRQRPGLQIKERLIKRYFSFIYVQTLFLAFKTDNRQTEQIFRAKLAENKKQFRIFTLSFSYLAFYLLQKVHYPSAKRLFRFIQKRR